MFRLTYVAIFRGYTQKSCCIEINNIVEGQVYISKLIAVFSHEIYDKPVPVAARSKAWVCGCSLSGNTVSNPAGDMDVCLL